MNKLLSITFKVAASLFISGLISVSLSAQTGGSKPIPENIMKIAQKSCVKCHAEPAKGMSISMVNLSKWATLSPAKQASKAKAMCNMVSKDKMPPKKFRDSNPDGIPSREEITAICEWATSLEIPKK